MRLQSYKKQVKRKRKPTKKLPVVILVTHQSVLHGVLNHYLFGCKDSEIFGYPLKY